MVKSVPTCQTPRVVTSAKAHEMKMESGLLFTPAIVHESTDSLSGRGLRCVKAPLARASLRRLVARPNALNCW